MTCGRFFDLFWLTAQPSDVLTLCTFFNCFTQIPRLAPLKVSCVRMEVALFNKGLLFPDNIYMYINDR